MDKITFLGTGAAMVQEHYQTSFVIELGDLRLLVDTMGGYDIYKALTKNGFDLLTFNALFITHRHIDHALGFVWVVRNIWMRTRDPKEAPKNFNLKVFCSPDLKNSLLTIVQAMNPNHWEIAKDYITFVENQDNKAVSVSSDVLLTPFNTESTKEEQYGFLLTKGDYKIYYTGDVPLNPKHYEYAKNVNILIHDCFCLDTEEHIYRAREKAHSTALDAAKNAANVNPQHLILTHIADEEPNRKERYMQEAQTVFTNKISVPDDGEVITI